MNEWGLIVTGFGVAVAFYFLCRMLFSWLFTGPTIRAHFSPKGGCTEAVVGELRQARSEILVLAYSFTSRPISEALVEARRRGVRVEILLDGSNEKEEHTDLPYLVEQGLEPLIDDRHAIAHNKVMLLDGRTLLTGSFNFTHQAEHENAENLLILKGHPDLVEQYRRNFTEHKSHARAVGQGKQGAARGHRRAA